LKNCLHDQVIAAAIGKRVFYLWPGPPPAVVALQRDPFLGWVVAEMNGPKNGRVDGDTSAAIRKAFAHRGISPAPDPTSTIAMRLTMEVE
jgi:hypothetical protein